MNDGRQDISGLSDVEQHLAQRLATLGPLMQEQEQAEEEMDQAFVRNLRAHLIHSEEPGAHPGFRRNLRSPQMRKTSARPVRQSSRQRLLLWMGAATAALAALLVGLLVIVLSPRGPHLPSLNPPYPTRADLLFSFPAPPPVLHRLLPTVSLVHPRPGIPYAGHLRLSAARLPQTPPTLRAYRLDSSSHAVAAGRRLLGIHSPIRTVSSGSATWEVAADGGFPSHRPLHSLAISLTTGELIYHDRRNRALPRAARALPRSTAVRVARRWLRRLGWPGNRMPLTDVERVQNLPKVREVEFGWIGVGATATEAATLWITPNRSVIEAWVWPPVAQRGTIPARSISAAWIDLKHGRLPLAVEGVSPTTRANGVGTVRRTSVVSILSTGRAGAVYLIPTYRFEGKAHIPGASIHAWYSLVPSARK